MALKSQYRQVKNKLYLEGGFSFANYTLLNGLFLIGFALALGADNLQLGILLAIPMFASLVQMFSAFILEFTGTKKKTSIISLLIGKLMWVPIILMAFGLIMTGFSIYYIMIVLLLSSLLVAIGNLSMLSWMKDLVPVRKLARFWGKRNIYATMGGVAVYIAGAYFIDRYKTIESYGIIFSTALIIGMIALLYLLNIPEKKARIKAISPKKLAARLAVPFRDRNFRPLLYFGIAWGFAINIAAPFFLVYMIDDLKLGLFVTSLFILVDSVSRMAGLSAWRGIADRFGARPLLAISATVTSITPLLFLFINRNNYPIIALIFLISAFSYAAVDIAVGQILFKSAPRKYDAYYLSAFTSTTGFISAIGPVIGGFLAVFIKANQNILFLDLLNPLKYVFLISFVLRASCIPMISAIYEPKASDVRDIINRMKTLRSVSFFVPVYNFADYTSKIVLIPQKQFFILQRKTVDLARKDVPFLLDKIALVVSAFSGIPKLSKIKSVRKDLNKSLDKIDYAHGSSIHEMPSDIASKLESAEKNLAEGTKEQAKNKARSIKKIAESVHKKIARVYKKEIE